jgi:O-antigen/teichoic acid export membrane protein
MSREAKVLKNSAILTLQHIIINIVTIFVVGYIARTLGKQDYGVYSLAFAFPIFFDFIGSFGLRLLALREIACDRENAIVYLGKIIPARILLIFLMALTILIAALVLQYESKIIYAILIATCAAVCEQFSRIIVDVFQAFEEMGNVVFRDIFVRVFTAASSIFVLLLGYGLYAVCFVYLIGSVLGLVLNIWIYKRRFQFPKLKYDYNFIRASLKEGSSYVLIGFASALYTKIDILLLSKMVDSGSLGIYVASLNLVIRLGFIGDAVATAVFPALSELYWTNREEANIIFNKAVLSILLMSLPIAIGGFILSEPIIILIYGSSYLESATVFSIFIVLVPLGFIISLLVSSLNAIRQQRFVAIALSIAAVVSFILNYLFISWMGYIGAAVATLLVVIFFFTLMMYGTWRYYKFQLSINMIVSILFALICLGYITYIARFLGLYITIPLAAASYYACLKVSGQFKNVDFAGKIF